MLSAAEGHTLVSVSKLGSKDTSKVGNSGLNFPFRIKDIQAGSPPRLLLGGPFSPIAMCPGEAHPKLSSLPWLGRVNEKAKGCLGMCWLILSNLPQLSPLLRARHWVFGSKEVSRSCQVLDVSKDRTPGMWPPTLVLVAMAPQSQQGLGSPQPSWGCQRSPISGVKWPWCKL